MTPTPIEGEADRPKVEFSPLAAELEARLGGKHLMARGPDERLVLVADFEPLKRSRYADVWNEHGAWRVQEAEGTDRRELTLIDESGHQAATMISNELRLQGDETLTWAGT